MSAVSELATRGPSLSHLGELSQEAGDRAVARSLPWIAGGLGIFYGVLAISHLAIVPRPAGLILAAGAALSCLVLGSLHARLRRRPPPAKLAHPIVAGFAGVALANTVTHSILVHEPQHSLNFMALAMGLGSCMLSRPWLLTALAVNFAAWLAVAWPSIGVPAWLHQGYVLASVSLAASLLQEVRLRSTARLVTLRSHAERTGVQLRRALDQARHELDQRHDLEHELRARQQRLVGMHEVLTQLTGNRAIALGRIPEAFDAIAEAAVHWFGVDRAGIWIERDDHRRLVCESVFDRRSGTLTRGAELDAERHPQCFRILEAGRSIAADDALTHPAISELVPDFIQPLGIRSMIAAPIRFERGCAGFLILSRVVEQPAWLPEEEIVAASLADLASLALHARNRDRDAADLRTLADELAQSNRDLEQFAYVASHDMQEPLRMVASYLQLLERRYGDRFDDKGTQYLGYAVDGAQRMRRLIDDLLTLSRTGRTEVPHAPVDLDDVVEAVSHRLSFSLQESGCQLSVEPLPRVQGDPSQLEQLFQNLVGNAIKYRGDGPCAIRIRASRRDPFWEIEVADDGIGFETAQAERIFAPFQRLHGREEYEGTGIGLAIVRRVVERHGGRIQATGSPGRGACFRFTLPSAESSATERDKDTG